MAFRDRLCVKQCVGIDALEALTSLKSSVRDNHRDGRNSVPDELQDGVGQNDLLNSVSIWEAHRATSAASSLFDPIPIGRYENS